MLKNILKAFASFVSDIWNINYNDVIDIVLNRILALLVVALVVGGIMLVCSIMFAFICYPKMLLYVGAPTIAIYMLTKALAAYGKSLENNRHEEQAEECNTTSIKSKTCRKETKEEE